ncbi:MAG TPA: hypothetical protein VHK90_12815 [Thermoanaerobaculia bacterium]|nr:hypothetical protein [Thermoanaerobaculia bacterium]
MIELVVFRQRDAANDTVRRTSVLLQRDEIDRDDLPRRDLMNLSRDGDAKRGIRRERDNRASDDRGDAHVHGLVRLATRMAGGRTRARTSRHSEGRGRAAIGSFSSGPHQFFATPSFVPSS